jgi:hypothetical protein
LSRPLCCSCFSIDASHRAGAACRACARLYGAGLNRPRQGPRFRPGALFLCLYAARDPHAARAQRPPVKTGGLFLCPENHLLRGSAGAVVGNARNGYEGALCNCRGAQRSVVSVLLMAHIRRYRRSRVRHRQGYHHYGTE